MTAKQYFGHFADRIALLTAAGRQLDVLEAGDTSAVHAEKVRMAFLVGMLGVDRLKTPNVITQFGSSQKPSLREIIEIAECCCFIKAVHCQSFR